MQVDLYRSCKTVVVAATL